MFKCSEKPVPNSLWGILLPYLSIELSLSALTKTSTREWKPLQKKICLFVLIFRYHLVYKCSYCCLFSGVQLLATCGYLRIIEQPFLMRLIVQRQQLKKVFLSVWGNNWGDKLTSFLCFFMLLICSHGRFLKKHKTKQTSAGHF